MLLKKNAFPEVGELLLCKVTNIQYNSVFCSLEEYENKVGMIHISEVSAGRIKNIREFVLEGKFIICKVLSVNEERGYIDLSLRRVSKGQQRTKNDEMKQEQRVEKLIEFFCKESKKPLTQTYLQVATPILKLYSYVFQAFEDVVKNNADLVQMGVPKDIAGPLTLIIKENIKPKEIEIKGILSLESYSPDGLEHVKTALSVAASAAPNVLITYAGGGKYHFVVKSEDFKAAEKALKESSDAAVNSMHKLKGTAEFIREET